MMDMVRRLLWFAIVATAFSYFGLIVIGDIVQSDAAGLNDPIVIRDELAANRHYLSGMLMVASPCDELSVNTQTISSSTYLLVFHTWREPSVTCASERIPRSFRTLLFAPAANVHILATIDDTNLPIVLLPTVRASQ